MRHVVKKYYTLWTHASTTKVGHYRLGYCYRRYIYVSIGPDTSESKLVSDRVDIEVACALCQSHNVHSYCQLFAVLSNAIDIVRLKFTTMLLLLQLMLMMIMMIYHYGRRVETLHRVQHQRRRCRHLAVQSSNFHDRSTYTDELG